jgi:Tfp pilus assembly protein PilF
MIPGQAHTVEEALEFAMGAIAGGDSARGKSALEWVLEQDPDNAAAWIWMSCCVPDERAKQECFRRASAATTGNGNGNGNGSGSTPTGGA